MMQQRKITTDRYPGPKPFEESEKDLFFGRSRETETLFESVSVNNVFVLHAESGLGKSSLIAAGLMPRLRTGNYLPILIRFKNRKTSPVLAVAEAVHEALKKNLSESQLAAANAGTTEYDTDIWKLVKKINAAGCVPVLIFDQFEEFNYFPAETRRETISKLSELTALKLPDHIRRENSSKEKDIPGNWYSQPEVKLIFSIRTDRIGVMEELAEAIPETRTNRYELSPMLAEQGEQVIILPAAMESTEEIFFNSQPFQYEPALIKTILEVVKRKDTIDTTQLQIICLEIQELVKNKIGSDQLLMVTANELGGAEGLKDLVKNFYVKQLAKISERGDMTPVEYQAIRILLEKKLIVQGKKDRLSADTILQHFRSRNINEERVKPLLDELLNLRLIRGIEFEESTFFEIAHDTLINPILVEMENRERREAVEKEKKQAEEFAEEQAEKLRKQRLQTAKEVELRKKATEAEVHAREEERKAREAEEKAKEAERKANAVAEELQKNLQELNAAQRNKRRMGRVIFGASVLFFLLSLFLIFKLRQIKNSRIQISALTAYKQLVTGDSAYEHADHYSAAINYLASAKSDNTEAADKLNQLPFSPLAWTDSSRMNYSFDVVNPANIVYSNDKSRCIIIKQDRNAVIWELKNNKPVLIYRISAVVNPVFSGDNRFLFYFRSDTTPALFDLSLKKVIIPEPAGAGAGVLPSFKLSGNVPHLYPIGKNYFIVTSAEGNPFIIEPTNSTHAAKYHRLPDFIRANPLDIMNGAGFAQMRQLVPYSLDETDDFPYEISPDGKFLSSFNRNNNWVFIYDMEKRKQVFSFRNVMEFLFTDNAAGFMLRDRSGNLLKGDCNTSKYALVKPAAARSLLFVKMLLLPDKSRLNLVSSGSTSIDYYYDFTESALFSISEKLKIFRDDITISAFSRNDIYFTPLDIKEKHWGLLNLKTGDTASVFSTRVMEVITSRKMNRLIYPDDANRLHILNAADFTETGIINDVNGYPLFFDEPNSRIYYKDKTSGELIEIDCLSNAKKSLGKISASISSVHNGLIELEIIKPGSLTATHCLAPSDKLSLKDKEKELYLRDLFRIVKLPGEK